MYRYSIYIWCCAVFPFCSKRYIRTPIEIGYIYFSGIWRGIIICAAMIVSFMATRFLYQVTTADTVGNILAALVFGLYALMLVYLIVFKAARYHRRKIKRKWGVSNVNYNSKTKKEYGI